MPRRVVVAENLIVQPLNNEAIALDIETETYYSLSGSGYQMWQAMTSTASIEEALEHLIAYYDVDEDVIRRDFEQLLDQLCQNKLIDIFDE